MPTSPITAESDLVTFDILSEGSNINDTIQIISIEVKNEANAVDESILTIIDGNAASGLFPVTDSKTFALNKNIEIKLGYYSKNETVFKGIVTEQKIIINEDIGSVLQVCCKNHNYEGEVIRKQNIDTFKTPILEVTYGNDILETELDINTKDKKTINGNIRFQGSAKAKVNDTISLEGLGSRFSKKTYISGVLHEVEEGNWITTVNVGAIS